MDGQTVKKHKMTLQNNSDHLLTYLISQANSGQKNWFGFHQQRLAGIHIAYEIAKNHADKLSPEQVADYANKLNQAIFNKLIRGE